jgi:hypothetical protein
MQADGHDALFRIEGRKASAPTLKNPEAEKSQLGEESKF